MSVLLVSLLGMLDTDLNDVLITKLHIANYALVVSQLVSLGTLVCVVQPNNPGCSLA